MFCSCASGVRVINPTRIGLYKNTPTDISTESEDGSLEKKTR